MDWEFLKMRQRGKTSSKIIEGNTYTALSQGGERPQNIMAASIKKDAFRDLYFNQAGRKSSHFQGSKQALGKIVGGEVTSAGI